MPCRRPVSVDLLNLINGALKNFCLKKNNILCQSTKNVYKKIETKKTPEGF